MPVVTRLLPEGTDLAGARALIEQHADVTAGRVRAGNSTFYDTFDGRLHADGLMLRHAAGRLALLDRETGETLATAQAPARAEPRLFDHDLAEALHGRLADVIEMRALVPSARVRSREITLGVLNSDQKTVVRLNVATHEGLRGRVSATAVRGYEKDLERVDALLAETLSLPEATVTLVDEAIAATGRPVAGTSAKLNLELDPEEPASHAAAKVFARLLEVIDDNFPGTLEDVDSEFLHDLRVAVRRTRSLQRQFKAIYPAAGLAHFREEFKRIQGITGDLRDLDVYLLDLPALKASLPRADAGRPRPPQTPSRAPPREGAHRHPASPEGAAHHPGAPGVGDVHPQRAEERSQRPVARVAPHPLRLQADGQDGTGDRRRQPGRGPA